jgi:hypothetical protein
VIVSCQFHRAARLQLWAALSLAGCHASVIDLQGVAVDPLADVGAASVLAFVTTECPISNQYAPELQRLAEQFGARGVHFWLVYPSRLDSVQRIVAHQREFAYHWPTLRDPEHRLVARAEVSTTPSVAVFGANGALAYAGRIDDRFASFGVSKPNAERHDLRAALEAVLSGRIVSPNHTAAVGCAISD